MGSSFSASTEFSALPPAAASTPVSANPPAKSALPPPHPRDPDYRNCWSCRVLSGCSLIGAGTYIYFASRQPMKQGIPPGPGSVMQMVIGLGIACWGVIVLVNPKEKTS
ncbi:distal membrane-arm assembly complex protein 1 [Mastomys coucha]|uniref:distal membrane-arm assembly complex protein 1 n=1 Tax=Mastomys coucha TaxID=35658 RepID=UPI001261DAFD|nr:distal membrane-arm assembly complex protein 1 [Mastomys coucha]